MIYIYEYTDGKVQVKNKYLNVSMDDNPDIYAINDRLFMCYGEDDDETSYKYVVELGEYLTELKGNKFCVYGEKQASDETGKTNRYTCWNEMKMVNTGIGSDGYGGSFLLRGGILIPTNNRFCRMCYEDFEKYLDYLAEQDISNMVQLEVYHAKYMMIQELSIHDQVDAVVWLDGVYYYVRDDNAYPVIYEQGRSEDDLPENIGGYKVKKDISELKKDNRTLTPYRLLGKRRKYYVDGIDGFMDKLNLEHFINNMGVGYSYDGYLYYDLGKYYDLIMRIYYGDFNMIPCYEYQYYSLR